MKYEKLNGCESPRQKKIGKWFKSKANRLANKQIARMWELGREDTAEGITSDRPRGWVW
jgi:hypothetical protein